jgi:superfamily II DNA or RNA helicase
MPSYVDFCDRKRADVAKVGLADVPALHPSLFPFQRDIVEWALRLGRAAIFADCGMGKTRMQLEWAYHVPGRVLILAPLAVGAQTIAEARAMGYGEAVVSQCRDGESKARVVVTNYERLHYFTPGDFTGVVLDESSILKSYMGKTKRRIIEAFSGHRWRLCCTATPAPNDYLELGNHAEFLGVLDSHEMIARWFLPDTSTFGVYRLKRHGIQSYWQWVSSWSACIGKPSDLGYEDGDFVLPALEIKRSIVDVDIVDGAGDQLFRSTSLNATQVHKEKRRTAPLRAARVAELVLNEPTEQWLIWCETNYEADALRAVLPRAVEIRGSDSDELKSSSLLGFANGEIQTLITKAKIAGFGMNWQVCARMVFVGPTFSYEQFYQAVRRCWRFGQLRTVDCHVVMASTEIEIFGVMNRKAESHEEMKSAMFASARAAIRQDSLARDYTPRHRAPLPSFLRSVL